MQEWIEQEFSSCDLGDRRLDDRLKTIISRISQDPSRSLSSACRGFAEVVACRRFFDNEVVSQSQLLAPHGFNPGRHPKKRFALKGREIMWAKCTPNTIEKKWGICLTRIHSPLSLVPLIMIWRRRILGRSCRALYLSYVAMRKASGAVRRRVLL
jgi:hypothetical protein